MVALGITFDEPSVPMGFKIRLNDMLTSIRADLRGSSSKEEEANSAPKS
jgi:hypothetical protein